MENMAVCRADMAALPQKGGLTALPSRTLEFARRILARAQSAPGRYLPPSLIHREEADAAPAAPAQYAINLTIAWPRDPREKEAAREPAERERTRTERAVERLTLERQALERLLLQSGGLARPERALPGSPGPGGAREAAGRPARVWAGARPPAGAAAPVAPAHKREGAPPASQGRGQAARLAGTMVLSRVLTRTLSAPALGAAGAARPGSLAPQRFPLAAFTPPLVLQAPGAPAPGPFQGALRRLPWPQAAPAPLAPGKAGAAAQAPAQEPQEQTPPPQAALARRAPGGAEPATQAPARERPAQGTLPPPATLAHPAPQGAGPQAQPPAREPQAPAQVRPAQGPAPLPQATPAHPASQGAGPQAQPPAREPQTQAPAQARPAQGPAPSPPATLAHPASPGAEPATQAPAQARPAQGPAPLPQVTLAHPGPQGAGPQAQPPAREPQTQAPAPAQVRPAQGPAPLPQATLAHPAPPRAERATKAPAQEQRAQGPTLPPQAALAHPAPARLGAGLPVYAKDMRVAKGLRAFQGAPAGAGSPGSRQGAGRAGAPPVFSGTRARRSPAGGSPPGAGELVHAPLAGAEAARRAGGAAASAAQAQPGAQAGPVAYTESAYVRSLPVWARDFLKDSFTHPTAFQPGGAGAQGGQPGPGAPGAQSGRPDAAAPPQAAYPPLRAFQKEREPLTAWAAPGYAGPAPKLTHKKKEKPQEPLPPPRFTDAEINRMADRVYGILTERMKRDRRRMGL